MRERKKNYSIEKIHFWMNWMNDGSDYDYSLPFFTRLKLYYCLFEWIISMHNLITYIERERDHSTLNRFFFLFCFEFQFTIQLNLNNKQATTTTSKNPKRQSWQRSIIIIITIEMIYNVVVGSHRVLMDRSFIQ